MWMIFFLSSAKFFGMGESRITLMFPMSMCYYWELHDATTIHQVSHLCSMMPKQQVYRTFISENSNPKEDNIALRNCK